MSLAAFKQGTKQEKQHEPFLVDVKHDELDMRTN
jgi:hypothetical protein